LQNAPLLATKRQGTFTINVTLDERYQQLLRIVIFKKKKKTQVL
jgi:hypothetical protein